MLTYSQWCPKQEAVIRNALLTHEELHALSTLVADAHRSENSLRADGYKASARANFRAANALESVLRRTIWTPGPALR